MTIKELIITLEEARNHLDDSKDWNDRANEAYYTINGIISDIENDGIEEWYYQKYGLELLDTIWVEQMMICLRYLLLV